MAALNYGYFYVDAQDTSHPSSQKLETTTAANWNAGNYNWNGAGYGPNVTMDSNYNLAGPMSILKYIYRHTENFKSNNNHGKERFLCEMSIQIAIKEDFSAYRMRLIVTDGGVQYFGRIKFGCYPDGTSAPTYGKDLPYGGDTSYEVKGKSNGTVLAESGNISTGFASGSIKVLRLYTWCYQRHCYPNNTNYEDYNRDINQIPPVSVADIYIKEAQANPKNLNVDTISVTGKTITVRTSWAKGTGNTYERAYIKVYKDYARTSLVTSQMVTSNTTTVTTLGSLENNTYYYLTIELAYKKTGDTREYIAESIKSQSAKTYGMTLVQTGCVVGPSIGADFPVTLSFKATEIRGLINGNVQSSKYGYWQCYAIRGRFFPNSTTNVYSEASTSSTVLDTISGVGVNRVSFAVTELSSDRQFGYIYYDKDNTRKTGWVKLSETDYFDSNSNGWQSVSTSISNECEVDHYYTNGTGTGYLVTMLGGTYTIIGALFTSSSVSTMSDVNTSIISAGYDAIEYQDIEVYSCSGSTITLKVKYKDSNWNGDVTHIYLETDSGESATYSRTCNDGGNIEALLTIENLANGVNYIISGTIGTDNTGTLSLRIYVEAKTYALVVSDIETSSKSLRFVLSVDEGTINRDNSGNIVTSYDYAIDVENLDSGETEDTRTGTIAGSNTVTLTYTNMRNVSGNDWLALSFWLTNISLLDVGDFADTWLKMIYFDILDTTDSGYGPTIGQNSVSFKFKLYLKDIDGELTLMNTIRDPISNTTFRVTGKAWYGGITIPVTDPYYNQGYNTDNVNHDYTSRSGSRSTGTILIVFEGLKSWCWYSFDVSVYDEAGLDGETPYNMVTQNTKTHTDYPYIRIHDGTEWKKCMAFIHNGTKFKTAITNIHNGTEWKEIDGQ